LKNKEINEAVETHRDYICTQTLAIQLELVDDLDSNIARTVEIDTGLETLLSVEKMNKLQS
jgi:isoleucyl-tRNA synthetase